MSHQERVLVLGAGGHGRVVADAARSMGMQVVGFLDDAPNLVGTRVGGLPVMAPGSLPSVQLELGTIAVALGIGNNAARQTAMARMKEAGLTVITVFHASAVVAPTAVVGEGSVVMANATINPDAVLGRGCIVNTGAVVEHDCVLENFVHLSPNVALGGSVHIGDRSHLGLNASVIPGTSIASDVKVGAGAVVIRPVTEGLTVVGVPARVLRRSGSEQ